MKTNSAVTSPQPVRSMSYSPESLRPCSPRRRPSSGGRPEWILCRNRDEFPILNNAMLRNWTEQGRIRPTDYLVSPRLDTCVQAKDIADLNVIFRKTSRRLLARATRALAMGGMAVVWLAPVVGSLMLLAAIVVAVLHMKEES